MEYKGYNIEIKGEIKGVQRWYCAYVELEPPFIKGYKNETYRKGNVLGVDTAHSWNEFQTDIEKYYDAIRQIKELIDDYLRHKSYMRSVRKIKRVIEK